jgi:hypothetical protein
LALFAVQFEALRLPGPVRALGSSSANPCIFLKKKKKKKKKSQMHGKKKERKNKKEKTEGRY